MTLESWLVLTVAAAFLLLGIAGSPLAWVALHHRRSRLEQRMETRWLELSAALRALETRLLESAALTQLAARDAEPAPAHSSPAQWPVASRPRNGAHREPSVANGGAARLEPALISVPNLAAAVHDRDALAGGLTQRYAAIWSLADNGSSPDVIARATGQPRGQIELILGLRRQVDGTRTAIPHAPHV
jgi:hypothetical protein